MEAYRGIMIGVFLVLTLIIPSTIAIRVFIKTFSAARQTRNPQDDQSSPSATDDSGHHN